MVTTSRLGLSIVLAACLAATSLAQDSGSGRRTLLQRIQGRRDARINRNGNNPQRERQPKLKKIADPSFLDPGDDPLAQMAADNPAIKSAAEIKAQEDLKDQKIKAIKYLAEVGCGCHPGVREALLAALDDCTEEVREEAALAFCRASGNACTACNPDGCCSADVMNKLAEMAHAKDGNGCYKEQSSDVRAAALAALNACRRVQPPQPAGRKEVPKEVPAEVPERETAEPALRGLDVPPEPTPEPSDDEGPAPVLPAVPPDVEAAGPSGLVNPVSLTGTVAVKEPPGAGCIVGPAPGGDPGGKAGETCQPYGPFIPEAPGEEGIKPLEPSEEAPEDLLPEQAAPSSDALAGAFGAAAGAQSAAPNMIGDLFGTGATQSTVTRTFTFEGLGAESDPGNNNFFFTIQDSNGGPIRVTKHDTDNRYVDEDLDALVYPVLDYNDASGRLGLPPLEDVPAGGTLVGGNAVENAASYTYDVNFDVAYTVLIPNPGSGGVVGKTKIAEDTSPLPQDRILFNYSFFESVPLFPGGVDVSRFMVGFEKTLFCGQASIELKAPMAVTLDSRIFQDGGTDLSHGEFGNLGVTFKELLLVRDTWALASGLTVAAPTADDTNVYYSDGTPLVRVSNRSVHLAPFFGFLWTPNERFFAQAFLQYDVDANGNPVYLNDGNGLVQVGRIQDATYQYLDVGIGSWIYRSCSPCARLSRVGWTAEVHWNRALQDLDTVQGTVAGPVGSAVQATNFQVGQAFQDVDSVNVLVGAHIEIGDTRFTLAYSTPVAGGVDREFDGEFRLLIDRYFGRSSRINRTPF